MLPMMTGYLMAGGPPGWWVVPGKTCVAAYQPIGAASLAASYTNLANPGTYNAAPGTAPTWASGTGWVFTGASSQYLTTGITPPRAVTWSMFARWSSAVYGTVYIIGSYSNGGYGIHIAGNATNMIIRHTGAGGTFNLYPPSLAAAVYGLAGNQAYRNGTPETGTISSTPDAGDCLALFIGARNLDGGPASYFTGNIQAVAIYSNTLSGAEAATLSAAMAALT